MNTAPSSIIILGHPCSIGTCSLTKTKDWGNPYPLLPATIRALRRLLDSLVVILATNQEASWCLWCLQRNAWTTIDVRNKLSRVRLTLIRGSKASITSMQRLLAWWKRVKIFVKLFSKSARNSYASRAIAERRIKLLSKTALVKIIVKWTTDRLRSKALIPMLSAEMIELRLRCSSDSKHRAKSLKPQVLKREPNSCLSKNFPSQSTTLIIMLKNQSIEGKVTQM